MAGSKITRSPTRWSYEKEVGDIYGSIVVGASGAVTSSQGAGVLSVVKETAAGQYTITLAATYQRLLMASAIVVDDAITDVATIQVFEDPATLQAGIKNAGTVTIQCVDIAGAAVNPTSGSTVLFKLEVRQNPSSVFDA